MQCPSCLAPTSVIEARETNDGCSIRRRRRCSACDRVFTTVEMCTLQFPPLQGLLTPFSRHSVITKVRTAAQKQPEVEDATARRSRSRQPSLGSVRPLRLPVHQSSGPDVNGYAPFPLLSASGRG